MLPLPAGGAPHLFFLAAVAALIGGLSAIERKGAFQLMLSRPIVLAPILGWGMGDAQGGLLLRQCSLFAQRSQARAQAPLLLAKRPHDRRPLLQLGPSVRMRGGAEGAGHPPSAIP